MRFTLVTVNFEMRFKTMVLSFSLQLNRRGPIYKGNPDGTTHVQIDTVSTVHATIFVRSFFFLFHCY